MKKNIIKNTNTNTKNIKNNNNLFLQTISSFFYFLSLLFQRIQLFLKISNNNKKSIEDKKIPPEKDYTEKYQEKFNSMSKEITYSDQELKDIQVKLEEKKQKDTSLDPEELHNICKKEVLDNRLNNYINNYILEETPLGNVAMCYNHKTKYFEYYSDKIVPYRFLETISKKYVIQNRCPFIYNLDPSEEENENEKAKEEKENKNSIKIKNTNVFAKFKNYNKEAGTGHVNKLAPSSNSISRPSISTNDNKPVNVENKNRYLCKGRFSNYPILQKIDRKKIDKEYAMSYSDFKNKNFKNI